MQNQSPLKKLIKHITKQIDETNYCSQYVFSPNLTKYDYK